MGALLVVKGVLYSLLWYLSIVSGYICLFCPILPIIFISNKLYRFCTDFIFTYWQMYPTILLQLLFNCEVQVTGDVIQTGETSLLIMNHRTRTDWLFLWPAIYQSSRGKYRMSHPVKFVLKDLIRHIPGIGWIMQLSCFLYIKRQWSLDKRRIRNMIGYFSDMSYKFSLLIFPEGTDFTEHTKQISDAYAVKNRLQKYNYVLHPHTTGFVFLAHSLLNKKELDAVYDITLVYGNNVPQNEQAILRGNFPTIIRMHFTKYPTKVLPKSEPGLKTFLEQRWHEKEKSLKEYHKTGKFLHGNVVKRTGLTELYLAFFFWTSLIAVSTFLLWTNELFLRLVFVHTLLLLVLNFQFSGFQNFEIALYNVKKRLFKFAFSSII